MSLLQTRAPMQAQLVQWQVCVGDVVQAGDVVLVLEAMKMEHELRAQVDGTVTQRYFDTGDIVNTHDLLLIIEQQNHSIRRLEPNLSNDTSTPELRADLQAVADRQAFTQDAQRPEAVAKRHALGLRTARENIADLCDVDASSNSSFLEYGALAIAAQRAHNPRFVWTHEAETPAFWVVVRAGSWREQCT